LRLLLLILAALWLVPRILRLLGPGRRGEPRDPLGRFRRRRSRPRTGAPERPDHLRDLTQQDISDADYEEIPPED
jgi:hypothetical protein